MVGMSAPYNAPSPYQQPGRKRGKPWTLIIGLLLGLIAAVLMAVGGWQAYQSVADLNEAPRQTGEQTVTLEEGQTQVVWAESTDVRCEASGPDGAVQDTSVGDLSIETGGESLVPVLTITATSDGDYTIACNGEYVVGDQISIGGSLTLLAGGLLCCLATLLIILGLILWLVRRNKR